MPMREEEAPQKEKPAHCLLPGYLRRALERHDEEAPGASAVRIWSIHDCDVFPCFIWKEKEAQTGPVPGIVPDWWAGR